MWTIVHFTKEKSIEIVPDSWIRNNNKTYAWPIYKKSASKLIAKKSYPNDLEHKWFSSRIIRQYLSKY